MKRAKQSANSQATETVAYSRTKLSLAAAITIVIGLASRKYPVFGSYPGDALWASVVAYAWFFVFNRKGFITIAALSLATSYAVELSQLYHAPWIDQIRSASLGRLLLGSGFDPIDLVAYTLGVTMALLLTKSLMRDKRACKRNVS